MAAWQIGISIGIIIVFIPNSLDSPSPVWTGRDDITYTAYSNDDVSFFHVKTIEESILKIKLKLFILPSLSSKYIIYDIKRFEPLK